MCPQLYRASALFETIRHEAQHSTDYKLSLFDLQTSCYQALQRVLVSLGMITQLFFFPLVGFSFSMSVVGEWSEALWAADAQEVERIRAGTQKFDPRLLACECRCEPEQDASP